ncbi:serine hydrolase domain-containing protein [Kordiimonas aquimaris]|uniref:serine hydrolase domain-containing protein n=1 Tax=Kordiimonas aquimaris TaxID=707591 RepID=UPI0021D075C1|nr:serine hydrolase domain-containing protein [Kordiimonas aquimaris]
MSKLIMGSFLAFLLTFTVNAATQEEPRPPIDQIARTSLADLETFMDAAVDTQMKALDIPAVSVSIVKDGNILLSKGYGIADQSQNSPVTGDTMFRPGSISKLFTWTAVMQLVESGKLDLNTNVNSYLTSFQIPDTYDEPITLTHILTHTAGFEEGALGYLIADSPDAIIPLNEALAKYIPRRINKPGAYSSYSNYATALAGLIISNVSGLSFNEYIQQNIFDPLGMTHSSFFEPLPDHLQDVMAEGYTRETGVFKEKPFEIIANFGPAGSLSSSASDMAKFMLAFLDEGQLNGTQILQPETVKLMHSRLFAPDERLASMAHGFYENSINGHRLVGHGGDTTLFHSNLMLDVEERLGIYVSYMGARGGKARGEIMQIFYDRYYPDPLEKLTPPTDFTERASKYAGNYKFWRHNQSTIEKAGALAGALTVTPTSDNTLLISGLGQARQFTEIGENLFRQVDGRMKLAFGENESGAIQDIYFDGIPFLAASRAPTAENGLFAKILPLISFLMFITVWTGWAYRRKEYKTMQNGERTAVQLSMAVSGLNLLFVISLAIILTIYQNTIVFNIPTALKVALWLPDIASITALGVLWFAVQSWRDGYWRLGRRIHYTLVALSGLFMLWFYYYWNFFGVQIA